MPETGEALVSKFFPGTGRSYDRVVRWTGLGRDRVWKEHVLGLLPPCRSILELASGTGILTSMLLARHPEARVLGVDITDDYVEVAREKLADRKDRFEFRLGDATKTPIADRGPFDAVVSCYLPKYVDPERLLDHVAPALAPGAVAVFHDFSRPRGVLPRLVWRAWFAILNTFAPWFHPEWKNVFDKSLVRLIRTSDWVEGFKAAFRARGWTDLRVDRLTFGAATVVFARWPGAEAAREHAKAAGR